MNKRILCIKDGYYNIPNGERFCTEDRHYDIISEDNLVFQIIDDNGEIHAFNKIGDQEWFAYGEQKQINNLLELKRNISSMAKKYNMSLDDELSLIKLIESERDRLYEIQKSVKEIISKII